MDIMEAIIERHSVRQYKDIPLTGEEIAAVGKIIDECNSEGAMHFQLVVNEPRAFSTSKASYGNFTNVKNYIALIGKKGPKFEESIGYYGEKAVIAIQMIGLNTCWTVLSFNETAGAFEIGHDEQLLGVIAVGHGENSGVAHESKPINRLCTVMGDLPDWFRRGMEAAMLAPTAMNQQKFNFSFVGDKVAVTTSPAFMGNVDLGVAKYHFEIGAGKENFKWA